MPSGKREPDRWLCLEPYVHMSRNRDGVLFYNSISGERFEIPDSPGAGRIAEQLLDPLNGYVVGITNSELAEKDITHLVRQLRKTFMGELADRSWSIAKPVNLIPEPQFKSHLSEEMVRNPAARDLIDYDNYIHEAVIYLDTNSKDSNNPLDRAAAQFVFPGNTLDGPASIPLGTLETLFRSIGFYKMTMIEVSGPDILRYPHLGEFSEILSKSGFPVLFHLRSDHPAAFSALNLLSNPLARLSLHFTFPLDADNFNALVNTIMEGPGLERTDFHFVVTSIQELDAAREIISATGLPNTYLSPLYTGNNFGFFRDAIFITREDILSSTPSQYQVFSRLALNESDFGKLTILPDGSVYANLNDPALGNLGFQSVENLILKELLYGKSWLRTRKGVSPCGSCLYHFLCPPVSSYELIMGRFNFCDVFE